MPCAGMYFFVKIVFLQKNDTFRNKIFNKFFSCQNTERLGLYVFFSVKKLLKKCKKNAKVQKNEKKFTVRFPGYPHFHRPLFLG